MGKSALNIGEFVILEALRRQDNLYGFLLQKKTEEILKQKRSIGGIYTTLHRLEAKTLVTAKWESGTNPGGARRRLYTLTTKGRMVCEEMRCALGKLLTG